MLWDKFIDMSEELIKIFDANGKRLHSVYEWDKCHSNYFWTSDVLEMGHISIIDMRPSKGMWMMHVNTYSKDYVPMPIYGFDVVVGKNKVTGCFHDMSPTDDVNHPLCQKFREQVAPFVPERTRPLPDWAKEIFSDSMIAAGNVRDEEEIDRLISFGIQHLKDWFEHRPAASEAHREGKAKYCKNQLMNENSKNVMVSLGLDEDYVNKFKKIQFPYV